MERDALRGHSPVRWMRVPPAGAAAVLLLAVLLLTVLAPAVTTAGHSAAQPLGPAARQAIHAVIEKQMAAFRDDDGPAAFALASPTIQRLFGTPEHFMRMVRRDYRPVYRPRKYVFMELAVREGQPIQQVLIYAPEGAVVFAYYVMERQPDGEWRIGGVFLRSEDRKPV